MVQIAAQNCWAMERGSEGENCQNTGNKLITTHSATVTKGVSVGPFFGSLNRMWFFPNLTTDSHSFNIAPVGPQVCTLQQPPAWLPLARRRADGKLQFHFLWKRTSGPPNARLDFFSLWEPPSKSTLKNHFFGPKFFVWPHMSIMKDFRGDSKKIFLVFFKIFQGSPLWIFLIK